MDISQKLERREEGAQKKEGGREGKNPVDVITIIPIGIKVPTTFSSIIKKHEVCCNDHMEEGPGVP